MLCAWCVVLSKDPHPFATVSFHLDRDRVHLIAQRSANQVYNFCFGWDKVLVLGHKGIAHLSLKGTVAATVTSFVGRFGGLQHALRIRSHEGHTVISGIERRSTPDSVAWIILEKLSGAYDVGSWKCILSRDENGMLSTETFAIAVASEDLFGE